MSRLVRSMKITSWALLAIWVAAIASVAYSVVTGEAFGSDVVYDTKGRIVSAVVLVVFVGFGAYSFHDLWKLKKEAEELRNERKEQQHDSG